jgi:hypothetical protein
MQIFECVFLLLFFIPFLGFFILVLPFSRKSIKVKNKQNGSQNDIFIDDNFLKQKCPTRGSLLPWAE